MDVEFKVYLVAAAYRLCVLLAGVLLTYMGYRLFLADKTLSAGDMKAGYDRYRIELKGAAPGIYFALFGTILIVISLVKGMSLHYDPNGAGASADHVQQAAPDARPSK
ncbi:MAG TPA: hypothetical protein VGF77_10620 [Allosphingosinicella sp.]